MTQAFPPRGNFGWQCLVGPYKPSAEAVLSEQRFYGLSRRGSAIYGCLRDEAGEMYEPLRSIRPVAAMQSKDMQDQAGRFILQTTVHHTEPCLRIHPASPDAALSVEAATRLEGGAAIWRTPADAKGRGFSFSFGADQCAWREDGVVDISGPLVGPGLQWLMTSANYPLFWVSALFEMKGTILGKAVTGFIGFDQHYLVDGGILENKFDPLVGEHAHRCWYTFATRYEDGSLDAGHFILGHDKAGFALLTNEKGEPRYTNRVSGQVRTKGPENVWPESITVEAEDETWEFLPDSRGSMPDILGRIAPTSQNEGRWRRAGDTRKPKHWFAWGEIAPTHGLAHSNRFRY